MRRVLASYYQPIRFARFDGKSVNRGLPVLDKARALDSCHRPEGSWALGTRMKYSRDSHETAPMKTPLTCLDFLLTGYVPGLPACIVERKIVPTTQLEVK